MSLSKFVLEEQVNVTQFLGLFSPQAELKVGGTGRTILHTPLFDDPVILNHQVGWPGEILKVTVFWSSYSPAQEHWVYLMLLGRWSFPLAVGLRTQFYPRTIGSHHKELLMLVTFQVESKSWTEYWPGIGSVVREQHDWTNTWIPKGKVVNHCVLPPLEEFGQHDNKFYRCQVQASANGSWIVSSGTFCSEPNLWKVSWDTPAPGLASIQGVAPMVTDGLFPKGFVPLRRNVSQVETEESGDKSEFEIIDSDE
ncbi:hypothetical protein CAEBREN_03090 [Caenorhabditis brenneri]|uniref:Uncharacterized protein n=1 Tax=Caenorhabditis brenneri TaxID=135651 RepID=G0NSU7_CAEBE|nr:hypothetical protein CAEBREN_03090 [Caenorhabditis brenneri]